MYILNINIYKNASMVLKVAVYWHMLLLNSLVDDISVINYLVTKMVTEKKDRTRKLNSIHTEKISFSFGSPWTNS